jgi:pantothenate kinase type III
MMEVVPILSWQHPNKEKQIVGMGRSLTFDIVAQNVLIHGGCITPRGHWSAVC